MKSALVVVATGLYVLLALAGCSVAMALHGTPEPNFKAFEVGSSRQQVEIQLGEPVASQPLGEGKEYIDLATFGIWELPGTIVEAMMGHDEETRIIYDANVRVLAIEGYTPPEPTGALKEAIEAQEKLGQPVPEQK